MFGLKGIIERKVAAIEALRTTGPQDLIEYRFAPKPDMTAYELAVLLNNVCYFASKPILPDTIFSDRTADAGRHYEPTGNTSSSEYDIARADLIFRDSL